MVEIVLGATGVAGRVLRYVGPITIAPTIALIGLALFKFGAPIAGQDWWIGGSDDRLDRALLPGAAARAPRVRAVPDLARDPGGWGGQLRCAR
ncbi:MAG: hypothetical protein R3F62_08795 [Planctomycetota bacterium]